MKPILLAAALALAATAASAQTDARTACLPDMQKLCAGVQPGGGRIMQCFKDHRDELSAPCKQALVAAMAARQSQAPAPSTAAPAAH